MSLSIPLRSGDVLQVRPSELSESVIGVLKAEAPPLVVWLEFAKAFLARGRADVYANVLAAALQGAARAASHPSSESSFHRIQALCSLAEFQMQKARASTDVPARGADANLAYKTLLKARDIDSGEMLPALCIGHWHLSMGQLGSARIEYERASRLRCNGLPSTAGALALAALHFRQGAFGEALQQYANALRACPSAPPEVRLGIAACHLRLGDVPKAEAAFARALELDPGCTPARRGLAALSLAAAGDAGAARRGARLLAQAFADDPDNPHVLVLLSRVMLRRGRHELAARLAQAALDRAAEGEGEDALRAEALCLLGRAQHALGRVQQAYTSYQQATSLGPALPLARLGAAQLAVLSQQHDAAAAQLEDLVEDRPGWVDVLSVLGPLLPRLPTARTGSRAARHFREAAERDPGQAELWEMLGDAVAASDPPAALGAFRRAIQVHRAAAAAPAAPGASGHADGGHAAAAPVPARLLNNAAVLLLRAGDAPGALALASEALASAGSGGLGALGALAQVTLGYNAARIREAAGDRRAAEAEYAALLAQFPLYVDCHLRLAALAAARGDLASGEEHARRAVDASGRSADSLAALAAVLLLRGDRAAAKRLLEELAGGAGSGHSESYARVALANDYLHAVPGDQRQEDARRKAESLLSHAVALYRRVLERDEGNVYAAHGVGCVLAESGRLAEAKEVFLRVQEAAAAGGGDGQLRVPDAGVNLAHTYLALGQPDAAARTYATAQQRQRRGRDDRLALYQARAQYEGGAPADALRTLCKAAHLAPGDARLRFNAAYVMQQHAQQLVNKERPGGDPSKAAELTAAVGQLSAAHRIFSHLRAAGADASGVPAKHLDEHIAFVERTHAAAVPRAEAARKEAAAAAARHEEQRLKLEAAARLRDVEARRRAAQAEAEARQREEVAREAAQRLERLKEEWRQGAALVKAAEKGDAGLVGKGAAQQAALRAGMADAMVDALFAVDEDEEDFEYVPGQDDSAGGGEGGGVPLGGTAALAAPGLVSSDEDGDSADFEPGGALDDDAERAEEPSAPPPDAAFGAAREGGQQKRGRLKKRRLDDAAAAAAVDVFEDEGVEEQGGGAAAGKRPRAGAALEDSDEDSGAGAAAAVAAVPGASGTRALGH